MLHHDLPHEPAAHVKDADRRRSRHLRSSEKSYGGGRVKRVWTRRKDSERTRLHRRWIDPHSDSRIAAIVDAVIEEHFAYREVPGVVNLLRRIQGLVRCLERLDVLQLIRARGNEAVPNIRKTVRDRIPEPVWARRFVVSIKEVPQSSGDA